MSAVERQQSARGLKTTIALLATTVPAITVFMFGGLLGWDGLMPIIWNQLPGISGNRFPAMMSRVNAAFAIISLLAPPLRILSAGYVEVKVRQNVHRLGVEDFPVSVVLYAVFIGYVLATSGIPSVPTIALTPDVLIGGYVTVWILLSYNAVPFYTDEVVPSEIDSPVDGAYILSVMLLFAVLFTIVGSYALFVALGP